MVSFLVYIDLYVYYRDLQLWMLWLNMIFFFFGDLDMFSWDSPLFYFFMINIFIQI